ncbi:hypothetical protein B1T47_16160 [Mycobacterium kansasii]|nr:hypothetical protein B1T47_16160 [Mycobacterium kansasii]
MTDSTVTASTTGAEQPGRTAGPAVPAGGGLSVAAVTAAVAGAAVAAVAALAAVTAVAGY